MKGVKRLKQNRIAPKQRKLSPIPRKTLEDETQVREDMLSDHYDSSEIEIGDELLYSRSGVQQSVMRKLRRGQFSIQGQLDLHGMTVPIARRALLDFIANNKSRGARCVRIIHGKGHSSPNKQPILKTRANTWLRQCNDVLAFCSAPRNDGGTGVVYVLLRR